MEATVLMKQQKPIERNTILTKPKSDSDEDLLFHKKGTPKCFPYLTRQVPKVMVYVEWELPHRGRGKLEFFEYSNIKGV